MPESNPAALLHEIARGYFLPRCLHAIAELGVADALDENPRTTSELAAAVNAHPDALARVLRLLAAHGIFELEGETVRHSAASRLLRTDHPQSMHALVATLGSLLNWATYEKLAYSVRTGLPAVPQVFPEGFWAYYAQHPQESRLFNAAMAAKAHAQVAGVMACYDFTELSSICDIGGGRGHLLQAVLAATPTAEGVLFDLPHVIEEGRGLTSPRLTLQGGNFFVDALPVCDAYLLMDILHDWPDEEAVAILRAIRRAAPQHAKLLVLEAPVPDDPGVHWTKSSDIHMLVLFGGRQRTRQEYATLLSQAGFLLQREIDTHASVSILEAVPVKEAPRKVP